jgi:hypothetical protein
MGEGNGLASRADGPPKGAKFRGEERSDFRQNLCGSFANVFSFRFSGSGAVLSRVQLREADDGGGGDNGRADGRAQKAQSSEVKNARISAKTSWKLR